MLWAEENKVPCGFLSNYIQTHLQGPVAIPVNSSPGQTAAILESLVRVELALLCPIDELLQKEGPRLPWGTTMVVMGKWEFLLAISSGS